MQKLTNLIVDHPAVSGVVTAVLIVIVGLMIYGFRDLLRFAPRRVWAIGGVVFRESIRRRILWLTPLAMFGVVILTGLQRPDDPSDAIRQTIQFCLFASGFLVIVSGIMLACTNLPRDIESKVVFTIVTKPTTRLEIVLGKIVGVARVTGSILILMGLFAWGYLHVRAWQLQGDIARQLAGPLDNEVARGRLEHQRQQGLLATRSMAYADTHEIVVRKPGGADDVRWASTRQNLMIPFSTTPEQLVPRGFADASKDEPAPPPGAAGVRVNVKMFAEQVGKVERPQPTVRAPLLSAQNADVGPYGQPEFRLSAIDLASGQELIPASLINGGKPFPFPLEASGKSPTIVLDEKAAPGLANSKHWGLVFAPTNENFLIGIKPGSAQLIVPGRTPDDFHAIAPDAGPDGKSPTVIARGNAGRGGEMLDGPQDDGQHALAIYHFAGPTPAAGDGKVALEMLMGIDRLEDDADAENTQASLSVVNRQTGEASVPLPIYPENGKYVYADVPAKYFDGGAFDVVLQTGTRGHAVTLADQGVGVVQSRHLFAINLAKALFSQWMLSVLVVTIGFFCSTFVSWPIAIVLSLVLLMGRWTVDQVSDSLQPGIGPTVATDFGLTNPNQARVVSTTIDGLARMLNVMSQFLPNIDLFSTGDRIERGLAIHFSTLGDGLLVLALFGVPLFTLAYVILRNKEVAP